MFMFKNLRYGTKITASPHYHKQHLWIGSCMMSRKSHYQTLGITSTASQADIKNAYYNLSMKFHPDKSKGTEEQFKNITSAYEVLGNPRLRRLYDRGIFSSDDMDVSPDASHDDSGTSEIMEMQSESTKTSVRTFDQWSKNLYSETFYRSQEEKMTREDKQKIKADRVENSKGENVLWILGLLMVLSTVIVFRFPWDNNSRKKS